MICGGYPDTAEGEGVEVEFSGREEGYYWAGDEEAYGKISLRGDILLGALFGKRGWWWG